MLKIATFIAALVIAGAFASQAEAHGMRGFYTSSFYRAQGMRPASQAPHCAKQDGYGAEAAFSRARAKRLAELRARRAAEAAAAAAAAKRARLAAARKMEASKSPLKIQTAETTSTAKKGDLQPISTADATPTKTAVAKTIAADATDVCRKFSAAADGLIEVPCK